MAIDGVIVYADRGKGKWMELGCVAMDIGVCAHTSSRQGTEPGLGRGEGLGPWS